jgi:hypothetical protein
VLRSFFQWLLIGLLHWLVQFLSWAFAGSPFLGTTAHFLWFALWKVVSSPTFLVFGQLPATERFEVLCIGNSGLWSLCIIVLSRSKTSKRQ